MEGNYTLSDVAAVTRNCDGGFGFGGDGAWIFGLLILLGIMNGGFGFGGNRTPCFNGEPVTEAALCNSMNFNNLENAVGRLSDTVQQGQRQTDNAICQLGYQTAQLSNQTQRDLCQGFAAVNAGINQVRFDNQQCCCDTQRAIDGTNYNIAQSTAAINANTTAGIQKVLDKMCETETNALRSRINQLELQQSLCGVVRYPTMTTYASNCNPFFGGFGCGCNCGCGNNSI